MIIDGIAASEAIDSSGESLAVAGCDITDFVEGRAPLNWEHKSGQESTALDVIGKVIYGKKILRPEDCENDRQRMYWQKVKMPYIYVMCRLFDETGHAGAQAVAAIIRNCKMYNEPVMVRYSIEGATLDRDQKYQGKLTASVARALAATIKPCNRSCDSDVVQDAQSPLVAKSERPTLGAPVELEIMDPEAPEELAKTLTAGGAGAAPGALVGGAALAKETVDDLTKVALDPKLGYRFEVKHSDIDGGYTSVKCYPPNPRYEGEHVGTANFQHNAENLLPESVWVSDDHRRQGIASHMYQLAEKHTGKKVVPSVNQTPEGQMFWLGNQSNPQFGKSEGLQKDDAAPQKIGKPDRQVSIQESPQKPAKSAQPKPKIDAGIDAKTGKKPAEKRQGAGQIKTSVAVGGVKTKPLPSLTEPVLDEQAGVLKTVRGTFPLYHPGMDETSEQYQALLNDPRVEKAWGRAMAGWTRAHDLLKRGKLPPEVIMHGFLFSQLSPNTQVPMQEYMYSHLVSAMQRTGISPTKPGFEAIMPAWQEGNRKVPDHSRDHFENHEGIFTGAGTVRGFDKPNNKMSAMKQYHAMHEHLVNLVQKHGTDVRSANAELMEHKKRYEAWKGVRDRATKAGKPVPAFDGIPVHGLASKTTRYALTMMGGGNSVVPDTHFMRHLFGMQQRKDSEAIAHVKSILEDSNRHHLLQGIDRWYAANHPAVKHVLEHPVWGKHFSNPEDAIFPAFWKHWMTIVPHEKMRGFFSDGKNELTTHAPFWDAIDPFTKAEITHDLPLRTAAIHQKYAELLGDVPASMMYFSFLLPRLLEAAQHREALQNPQDLLAGAAPRLERLAVELRQHVGEALYHGGPQVRSVQMVGPDGATHPAGRFMIHNGQIRHLEDYHGLINKLLPDGTPMDDRAIALLHILEASPKLRMRTDHDLPEDPDAPAAAGGEEQPQEPQQAPQAFEDDLPPPADAGVVETYIYRREGMDGDHVLEVQGDQAYLDGSPLIPGLVRVMLENVERGSAQLRPMPKGGLAKSEDLQKNLPVPDVMDVKTMMGHIRAAEAAGHLPQGASRAATRHIYEDKLTPGIGNKYAADEFKSSTRPGVHIAMDGNSFKHINDVHGHKAGDEAIQTFGRYAREAMDEAVGRDKGKLFRDPDVQDLFRDGGDEFLAHVPSYEHAVKFMHSLRGKLDAHPPIGGSHKLSMSFGLGHTHYHADQALYQAKNQKKLPTGMPKWAPGQEPSLAHSLLPGREGPIALHTEHPPGPVLTPKVDDVKTATTAPAPPA